MAPLSPTPQPPVSTQPASAASPALPLEWDAGAGRLSIGGQAYLLIRPQTLAPLGQAPDLLEAGGREGGSLAAGSMLARGLSGREAFEELLRAGGQIGWGTFTLRSWGESRVEVELRNSPFAQAATGPDAPACHLVRGILAGALARILGRDARAREERCAAMGQEACRFEIEFMPREERQVGKGGAGT
ncbi:MAG: hypothetical protein HY900_02095 [Deltaproteobacteria bacterium]|nr:hypothetical protein [Deltaproteobacteria bacterium]